MSREGVNKGERDLREESHRATDTDPGGFSTQEPQRHSQIRRSGQVHRLRLSTSAPSATQARPFIAVRWHHGHVAVAVAVKTLPYQSVAKVVLYRSY